MTEPQNPPFKLTLKRDPTNRYFKYRKKETQEITEGSSARSAVWSIQGIPEDWWPPSVELVLRRPISSGNRWIIRPRWLVGDAKTCEISDVKTTLRARAPEELRLYFLKSNLVSFTTLGAFRERTADPYFVHAATLALGVTLAHSLRGQVVPEEATPFFAALRLTYLV